MLHKLIAPGLVLTILFGTACTIKGSGSQRERYESKGAEGSGDASAEDGGEVVDEGAAACLKLAEKRKNKLKLQDEEEEVDEEEVVEEEEVVDECAAEEVVEEEVVEEEVPEDEVPVEE